MTLSVLCAMILLQALAMAAFMAGAWLVRRLTGNSGWIDTTWTFAVGIVGAASALITLGDHDVSSRQHLVVALVVCWSLRLGGHIALRTWAGTDDPRYAALAREWGDDASRRMFQFAQIQAAVAIPLLVTIAVAAHAPAQALGSADWLGAAVLAAGIAGEGVADHQLRQFAADPAAKGQVCDRGLWSWSRHPNYFFQWLGWLAYPILCFGQLATYPWALLTLSGALCMYWLLVHVSGIPPLERHMLASRGDAFRAYQARTNAFFLGPHRAPDARRA